MTELNDSTIVTAHGLCTGLLATHLDGFATLLDGQGYAPATVRHKSDLLADFGAWLAEHDVPLEVLGEAVPLPRAASFSALNEQLLADCRRRLGDQLRGHQATIGARLARDQAACVALCRPTTPARSGRAWSVRCRWYGITEPTTPFHRQARRADALVLLDKGMSCQSIAEVLLLDGDTIRTGTSSIRKTRSRVWRASAMKESPRRCHDRHARSARGSHGNAAITVIPDTIWADRAAAPPGHGTPQAEGDLAQVGSGETGGVHQWVRGLDEPDIRR